MYLSEELFEKWGEALDHDAYGAIKDPHRRLVTATILENTEKALMEEASIYGRSFLTEGIPANVTSWNTNIDAFDPVLISLIRRAMPNLIAYDIAGVQPMTGPTGLIFAMRARYSNQTGTEAFYNEPNTQFASNTGGANTIGDKHVGTYPGNSTTTANLAEVGLYNYGNPMSTTVGETLGVNTEFPEMAFSIEKVTVEAKTRAMKAEYTMELAQDLKAIHGLDAESELANMLSTEILAEINREVVRRIVVTAQRGASEGTTTVGRFDLDVDANGRWMVEKFKGLMYQIEREANQIAKNTRRGKGNIIICSSDVASALQMTGMLDNTPALNANNLQVDDTGSTFVGVLNGRFRVYIDPYTTGNYMVVGYKGANAFDAGLFYCPYVPLQMVRAVDPNTFQPKIGFKTRYGMVANPFAEGSNIPGDPDKGRPDQKDSNVYYRRLLIDNIL